MAAELTSGLTEKIGPLPAIAWAGIAVGGFVIFRTLKTKLSPPPPAVNNDVMVDPSLSADSGPIGDNFGSPPLPGSGVSGITTNQQWSTLAATGMIQQGKYTPAEVELALWGYLNGSPMDAFGQRIVNESIAQFGPPPEGNIPVFGPGTGASSTGITGVGPVTTNVQWSVRATQLLMTENRFPAVEIQLALWAYLSGAPLSAHGASIINRALQLAGPPPEGNLAPPMALTHHT